MDSNGVADLFESIRFDTVLRHCARSISLVRGKESEQEARDCQKLLGMAVELYLFGPFCEVPLELPEP